MAEFRPNDAQREAIYESGKNILVSAGAGSGKTTVLVERVLHMILEEGVDIDSLIIVTFTRAAAANMKEKIHRRIRTALKDDTLSDAKREHLNGQLMKVLSAKICTIDSLCMDIVREHFQYVDIDPAFRIADEAEITLLMQDVLSQLIEDHYAEPTEDFINFVNYYTDKTDAKLDDIILTLYRYSQSHPEPERWLKRAVGPYIHADRFGQVEDQEENKWLFEFAFEVNSEIEALKVKAQKGLLICGLNYGPEKYTATFEKALEALDSLDGLSFTDKGYRLAEILENWGRLPSVKKEEVSEDLKQSAQDLNKAIKDGLKSMRENYFYQDLDGVYADMGSCAGVATTIVNLVLEFSERLMEEKKARLIADFNDVAHFALGVLVRRNENDELVFTEAADSIARATKEIIVDEYQDTNRMQDALLTALSAERFGRPNIFMVGDVKQSIYGFRLACPDLFIEKYNMYTNPEGNGKRIILGANYRSRKEIVDFINLVFEKIMIPEVGGIDYLDGNQMEAGAIYPEAKAPEQVLPEVLFIDGGKDLGKDTESYVITRKIEEIVDSYFVTGEDGELRKARYSDIAILTRTTNNPRLEKMLTDRYIPVQKSSSRGFFESFEIRLTIDLLKTIDNPYQDIPLAAVLLSPVAGLNANALARIKTKSTVEPFCLYEACREYVNAQSDEDAAALQKFLEQLSGWRKDAEIFGIRRFLDEVLEESGLSELCHAMTYGEGRAANLQFLKELAESFSKGSYNGLFNFLRYIDAVKKADQDFGSAQTAGTEDAVTMMTIHKSKGLEFPVVILADAGKQISDLDSVSPVYLDDDLGIGLEVRELSSRIKRKTLLMETISLKKKTALISEEVRLLYVAMSRAKEKLIITGSKGTLSARRREWESEAPVFLPDAGTIRSDKCYMYLLADAMLCATEEDLGKFRWQVLDTEEVEIDRAFEVFDEKARREQIENLIQEQNRGEEETEDVLAEKAGIYSYEYPFASATKANVKVTASQMEQHETERDGEDEEKPKTFYPKKEGVLTGAERGNAYHKLFELLDYPSADSAFQAGSDLDEFSASEIERLRLTGYLTEEAAAAIDPKKITAFLLSEIGTRMRKAALAGTLRREQQFVMSAEIDGNPEGLLQGIIDAFFIEEDEQGKYVVLVDYKTNKRTEPEYFIETYNGQQAEYAKACEKVLSLPVKEMILYSVELEKEIFL